MPPIMAGLLAAVATVMPALVSFAHGFLVLMLMLDAAAAAGLVVICTLVAQSPVLALPAVPDKKKSSQIGLSGI
jgi:hypothetical protein